MKRRIKKLFDANSKKKKTFHSILFREYAKLGVMSGYNKRRYILITKLKNNKKLT